MTGIGPKDFQDYRNHLMSKKDLFENDFTHVSVLMTIETQFVITLIMLLKHRSLNEWLGIADINQQQG